MGRFRRVGRWVGWALLVCALLAFGGALQPWIMGAAFKALALGQLWYHLDGASLNAVQAFIQRYLHPAIWEIGFTPFLLLPAWGFFGGLGGGLAWFLRRG